MKKIFKSICLILAMGGCFSCSDFLDIVPEGVASMDNAFSNRENSMKFLYTCYSYIPNSCHPDYTPGLLTGDEFWMTPKDVQLTIHFNLNGWDIGRGYQNANDPLLNFWDGTKGGTKLWVGIRDCNIFLENIDKPQDLQDYERNRWVSEVKFLKAYYHFLLFRMYGPIPIINRNIEVNEEIDQVRKYREPVDKVVEFITETLDECVEGLPLQITDRGKEMGRITQPIAKAIKAQTLLLAASPLFNGNPDYVDIVDNRGVELFPSDYKQEKWEIAAKAAKEAIECALKADHRLFEFKDFANISDFTRLQLSISNAVTNRWNEEIVFGTSSNPDFLQRFSMPALSTFSQRAQKPLVSVSMNAIEDYYTNNGVPMAEDNSKYWQENYNHRYEVTTIPDEGNNKYILDLGEETAKMHLNREPRFYANIGFDRGTWYLDGNTDDLEGTVKTHFRRGETSGRTDLSCNITGYYPKKLTGIKTYWSKEQWVGYRYTFPIIRLAELYLMYAECLNESLAAPTNEVYAAVDVVRKRAGLEGVVESWKKYSINAEKPRTKSGMREIIRQERMNELSLEGHRFWDMRRWKIELNSPIYGWNIDGETTETFYKRKILFERQERYTSRDYLWPISNDAILKNPNLVQNLGW